MKTTQVLVLKLDTCNFLTSFKPEEEGKIIHLADSAESFARLPDGKALEIFNKNVAKDARLADSTPDDAARKELLQLVKDNLKELIVDRPSAKKERGGKAAAEKGGAKRGRGRPPEFADSAKIIVVNKFNPFRKGTVQFDRMAAILSSKNVQDARSKVPKLGDMLKRAVAGGYVRIA